MNIEHLTTSPYHPQCNSQAEIVNKTIAKYLSAFVDDTTLDWEMYLPPLMFSYNTSMHSTTKFTPFFLTFGQQPRAPHFPSPDLSKKFYGESSIDEMWLRLQQARQLAVQNNEEVRDDYEKKFNKQVLPITFSIGQEVFLDEHNFLHKNKKLAPQFSGPHIIEKLIGKTNAQIKLKNGRSTIVHLNRLKPFLSQSDKLVEKEDIKETAQHVNIHPPSIEDEENDDYDTPPNIYDHPRNLLPTLPHPPINPPVKRGRGRPRKGERAPTQSVGEQALAEGGRESPPPFQPRVTRSQIQQMSEQERADYFAVSFITTLKLLSSDKKHSKTNNKKVKDGSSNAKWSKLQKLYFKLYGDIQGPPTEVSGKFTELPGPEEYPFPDFDSDSEWENFEYGSESEWERLENCV